MMLRGLVPILCILAVTSAMSAAESAHSADLSDLSTLEPIAEGAAPDAFRALPFFYDLYTFRSDGDWTTVVTSIAVPVRRLNGERRDRQVRYRFDVRFALADTADRTVIRSLDSIFVSRPRPLPAQHLLHTHIETEAPPSSSTLQRLVVTDATRPGVGQLYTTPFPIPDYSGTELMLSSIALGLPDATSGWDRNGVTLALLPTSQFPESSFDVYYEIYNLPSGSSYETEVSIASLNDEAGEAPIVSTFFSGEANADSGGTVAELRRVQSALPKGSYRLTVTVTDEARARSASQSRVVEVRGWRSGTTLVPAMPRN